MSSTAIWQHGYCPGCEGPLLKWEAPLWCWGLKDGLPYAVAPICEDCSRYALQGNEEQQESLSSLLETQLVLTLVRSQKYRDPHE